MQQPKETHIYRHLQIKGISTIHTPQASFATWAIKVVVARSSTTVHHPARRSQMKCPTASKKALKLWGTCNLRETAKAHWETPLSHACQETGHCCCNYITAFIALEKQHLLLCNVFMCKHIQERGKNIEGRQCCCNVLHYTNLFELAARMRLGPSKPSNASKPSSGEVNETHLYTFPF